MKVQGANDVKEVSGTIKNLKGDLDSLGQVGGPLGNTLNGIIGRFGALGTAAGLAAGAVVALGGRALQIAGELSDIAGATGIAAGTLMNFKNSVIEAGGKADDFAQIAAKLNQSVQEAASGNEKLQDAFRKLGVFVRDANGNIRSTETILQELTKRFQDGQLSGAQYSAAIDILGKNINKLELAKLQALRDPVADADIKRLDQYNEAIDKIRARLERGIVTFFGAVAQQAENAFSAIDKYNKKLEETERQLNAVGRTSRAFVAGGPAASMNMAPGSGPNRRMTEEEKAFLQRQQFEADMAARMASYQSRAGIRGQTGDTGDYGARSEAGIKAAAESAKRAAQSITEAEKNATMIGLAEIARIRLQAEKDLQKEILNIRGQEKLTDDEKAVEIAAKRREILSRAELQVANVTEQQNKQLKIVSLVSDEFEKQADIARARIDQETDLIGKTEREVELARQQRDIFLKYKSAFDELAKRKASLGKDEQYLNDVITQQQDALTKAYYKQDALLVESINKNQTRLDQERRRAQEIKNITALMEEQAETARQIAEYQTQVDRSRVAAFEQVKATQDQLALTTQQEQLERSIRNMRGEDQAIIKNIFNLEQERQRVLESIAKIPDLPYAERLKKEEEINAAYNERRKQIEDNYAAEKESQNSFVSGWDNAFERWRNNLKTDAERAEEVFKTLTTGFEDAIVKFVNTGKLSFKDLFNSLIAQALKVAGNNLLMSIFGGAFGGGTGGNFLTSLFGGFRAAGGPVNPGKAYVVGEKGPELFVPRTPGGIIPNGADMGGGSGGITQITYQIQAVDASSFRQLVARDPEFIFNVTEQGRRSLPTRSRR
jgi:lambda family phage tail tape measure protein